MAGDARWRQVGARSHVSLESLEETSLEETLQPQISSVFNANKGDKRGPGVRSKGEHTACVLKSQE